jgi:hypothetical protein
MYQGRIDHVVLFGSIEEVRQVAEMSIATSNAISSAVFVKHKDLAGAEPSLEG